MHTSGITCIVWEIMRIKYICLPFLQPWLPILTTGAQALYIVGQT